jgi:hypothetical protein
MERHLIRCTKSWQRWGERHDFVLFQNDVVRSKASCDAFSKKAVRKVLCIFESDDVYGGSKRHSLALIDIFLPMRPTVRQKNASGEDIAHLKHNGMFLLEKQNQRQRWQVVVISCFHWAAHVVSTDIWEKRWWLNNYIDFESYNDMYNRTQWRGKSWHFPIINGV